MPAALSPPLRSLRLTEFAMEVWGRTKPGGCHRLKRVSTLRYNLQTINYQNVKRLGWNYIYTGSGFQRTRKWY